MKIRLAVLSLAFVCLASRAADVPGGLTQTGDILPTNTYELLLSPAYTLRPAGAYLSSQVRYQPSEDFGAGFGFGAGEVGFNFGVNGTWYLMPDMRAQPAVAIMGGLYLNRLMGSSYFVAKIAPMVSKQVQTPWGKFTPYAGVHLAPSFRLAEPQNELSMRASVGAQMEATALDGIRLWTEVGVALLNSVDEVVVGLSYPFAAL